MQLANPRLLRGRPSPVTMPGLHSVPSLASSCTSRSHIRSLSTTSDRPVIPRRAMLYGQSARAFSPHLHFLLPVIPCAPESCTQLKYSTDLRRLVPCSNPRMIEKSLSSAADSKAYDLEDSVSANKKSDARRAVSEFLNV